MRWRIRKSEASGCKEEAAQVKDSPKPGRLEASGSHVPGCAPKKSSAFHIGTLFGFGPPALDYFLQRGQRGMAAMGTWLYGVNTLHRAVIFAFLSVNFDGNHVQ